MILADALAITLRDLGVSHVFGVSGANIELFHDAVHRLGESQLHNVLAKSESGAAFMADGFARRNSTLGVCCSTSGGGMMNLAVGVAEAQAQAVPVLAIVGQPPLANEGQGAFQDSSGLNGSIDALAMWQSITNFSSKICQVDDFWPALQNCLTAATQGRQGAAALLIPRDLMQQNVPAKPDDFPKTLQPTPKPSIPAEQEAIDQLLSMLGNAQRPIAIMGEAAGRNQAHPLIVKVLQQMGIPVATTLGNIAAFDHSHPQYIGTIGHTGHPSTHKFIEQQADCILAIGTQLDQMTIGPLVNCLTRLPLAIINHSIDAVPPNLQADVCITADVTNVFEALQNACTNNTLQFEKTKNTTLEHYPAYLATAEPAKPKLRQSQALAAINPLLPKHSHLIFDAGNCAAAAAHYINAPQGSKASIALGMAGMGYGIASAIGVALAQRQQNETGGTVVFCGDGAFMINGLELHTAAELHLPILWIVFNNNQHGMCVTRQQTFFDNRIACSQFSVPVDISTICKGLGNKNQLRVAKARNTDEIEHFLNTYWQEQRDKARGPAVLELMIDAEEIPPFGPLLDAYKAKHHSTANGKP